ncbi:hypothetical protein LIER_04430 [Lithospermum erythrorhizon]|uniref:Uncharacterized protein n=1 Tax=Lithospermum erythrorhizon TaxID=34254 RepID=A0AAV3NZG7_LITER
MEAFHAVRPLLSAEEGRKHLSSDPMDFFALCALYMIKAFNGNYSDTRCEVMREVSFEKTHAKLEAAEVSLKERDEELNSYKEALSAEEVKCHKLQEEKQTVVLEHVKSCNTLEAELEKLKHNHSSLAKDVEDTRSTKLEAVKRAEAAEAHAEEGDLFVGKESVVAVYGIVTRFHGDFPQLVDMYNQFKKAWPEAYFEGLSVDSPLAETPTEDIEVAGEGDEVAEEAADDKPHLKCL